MMSHFRQFLCSLSCRLYDTVILQNFSVKSMDLCGSLKSYLHVTVKRVSYYTLFVRYCLGVVFT